VRDTALAAGDALLLEGEAEQMTDAIRQMGCLPLADRRIALQPFRIYTTVAIMAVAVGLVATMLPGDRLPAGRAGGGGVRVLCRCANSTTRWNGRSSSAAP
jgi:hypothetical protein